MRYRIKALHPGMGVTATTVEALDEAEAAARLQREGAQVLSIVAERGRWLAGRGVRFPLLLIGGGTLVIGFLRGYVVPRFASVYADAGRDLPWMSKMLLAWGEAVEAHGVWILLGAATGIAGFVLALTQPATRAALTRLAWRIPAIGEHLRTFELARFYRSLGMLLTGGIPIVSALGMVSGLLSAHMRSGAANPSPPRSPRAN